MTIVTPLSRVPDLSGPGFGARLTGAGAAVSDLAAGAAELDELPDDDVLAVMRQLTSMTAELDGLRVATAAVVRDRDLTRRQGARSLTGWLRAGPRTADDAWRISQLAAASGKLPKILSLLRAGQISLAQAGAAVWQVSQLPDLPARPEEAPDPAGPAPAGPAPAGIGDPGSGEPGDSREPGDPDEAWAGLWRAGDVHAAADELFSRFLPSLDASQLRVMGAHVREAADAQERATDDYDDYARRRPRISRTFGNIAEITGRLHAEAAEQIIAAFEHLGVKHGPDDPRTKAQRWADVLTRLASAVPREQPSGSGDDHPGPDGDHSHGRSHGHSGPGNHDADGPERLPAVPPGFQRPRVIVTVPLSALLGWPLAPGAMLGSGTPLGGDAARRLACDAEIMRVITGSPATHGDDGQACDHGLDATGRLTELFADAITALPRPLGRPSVPLDVGRKHPGWTSRQRDALHAQYGGRCGFPRCSGPIDVIHHVIHWTHDGPTALWNGLPLRAAGGYENSRTAA